MSSPAIGGKVVDASALAALVSGHIGALTWFTIAARTGIVLYLPTLALVEVRAVRPVAATVLADVLTDPAIILGEMDAATAAHVDELLQRTATFDALAGQVCHVAARRGWPVLSDDPQRLTRISPDLDITPL